MRVFSERTPLRKIRRVQSRAVIWKGFVHLLWFALLQVIKLIFELLQLFTRSQYDKDLEILLLRRQLAILQRHQQKAIRPTREDKFILAFLTKQFKQIKQATAKQLHEIVSIAA